MILLLIPGPEPLQPETVYYILRYVVYIMYLILHNMCVCVYIYIMNYIFCNFCIIYIYIYTYIILLCKIYIYIYINVDHRLYTTYFIL